MAEKATLARPYARAAFSYARNANALATWGDALNAAAVVVSDSRVKQLIGNPKVSSAQLVEFIASVTTTGSLDAHVRNFLDELAHNGRLGLLPEVAAMFEEMRNDAENVADVQVTSAVELNDAQRERLATALKKRLKRDVRLHCNVDPQLLGGAVITSGDWVLDGSLRASLSALSTAMSA